MTAVGDARKRRQEAHEALRAAQDGDGTDSHTTPTNPPEPAQATAQGHVAPPRPAANDTDGITTAEDTPNASTGHTDDLETHLHRGDE